jgi:AcrR family transcriptional regulator
MDVSRKRVYSSRLRAEQARRTRRTIVDAAARLFVAQGFGATTIDDVAAAADVSRKTVFTAVGGKVELLKLALDWAVVGDDEPVPLGDRPEMRRLRQESDPARLLQEWARILVDIDRRGAALSVVLAVAAGIEPAARRLWEQAQAQRLDGARAVVVRLVELGGLRDGLTAEDAADIAWLHIDPTLYTRLVLDRGWSSDRFADWLARTMSWQLLGVRGAEPGGSTPCR